MAATALPASTGAGSLTDSATTNAQNKTNLQNLRAYLAYLLDTSGEKIDALQMLKAVGPGTVNNLGLAYSVASSALTIALKQKDASSDATADLPVFVAFRSATANVGDYSFVKIGAALSVVVSNGSTLGRPANSPHYYYVYLINNAGTAELAVSAKFHGTQGIVSTTAEGGAGGADSGTAMYSTTARSNVAFLLVGRFKAPQTTAGAWAAGPTAQDVMPKMTAPQDLVNVFSQPLPTEGGLCRNVLDNPDGRIAQRGLGSGLADDVYDFDRWYALTQTGTVASSQLTDVADGTPFMMRMTQSQASAQRMGRAQIIEGKNCKHLRGRTVTLTPKARISASQAVRYAILEWTGTEDTVTSDVVNDWTSGTYTAGNFFIATTTTVSGVGAQTPAAATLTTLDKLTVTLGSSFNNLIVLAWTEGTAAQNVTLDLAMQLEAGSEATELSFRPMDEEVRRCQRYYEKSYNLDVAPGTASIVGAAENAVIGLPSAAYTVATPVWYRTTKRVAPSVTAYSHVTGTSGKVRDGINSSDVTATAGSSSGTNSCVISATMSGASTSYDMIFHWIANAEL